jgi:RNA 2',3'-cyclic 3'-phosphodiesterase
VAPARPGPIYSGRRGDPFAGIPGRRIFAATPLPDRAREAIEELVGRVRADVLAGEREVRWVRLDGLHVTLRFLGPTLEPRIPDAVAALAATAAAHAPFEAGLDGAGAFPGLVRPRALWLGIGDGSSGLAALAGRLGREFAARGWPADDRSFQGHLTLARSDGVASGARTAQLLIAAARDVDVRWTVERLVLFESVTGGGPARYVPLETFPLSGAPLDPA